MKTFEILALTTILLFGLLQVVMTIASIYWFPKLLAWKKTLLTSQSTLAKLELIIFF